MKENVYSNSVFCSSTIKMKLAIKCYIFGNTVTISIAKKLHFLADTSVYNHLNLLNQDK